MKGIENMNFLAVQNRDGKWIGMVREFGSLRTRPKADRLDALSEIVTLTSERIREIEDLSR